MWTDQISSRIDGNRTFSFATVDGEAVCLPENYQLLFETDSLGQLSPATASRCGIIQVELDELPWKSLAQPWLLSLPLNLKTVEHIQLHQSLFEAILFPMIEFVYESRH